MFDANHAIIVMEYLLTEYGHVYYSVFTCVSSELYGYVTVFCITFTENWVTHIFHFYKFITFFTQSIIYHPLCCLFIKC